MNIDPADYPNLRINGPITAQLAITPSLHFDVLFLIVGPTGAGKSTFIEALAQDPSLRISSNQLEGFTQTINTYHVKNVKWRKYEGNYGTYLVDVPGFADTKISMTNIISMLKEWMQESKARNLGRILYFIPIHSVRLPGSQREVLRTFQALTGAKAAGDITIVTTMWDTLWGDGANKRAESNFNELRDTVWKEFIDEGSQIVKFQNTKESALSILNTAFGGVSGASFRLERQFSSKEELKSTPFARHLTDELKSRIQNLEIGLASTKIDLKSASEGGDDLLISMLVPKLQETEMLLARFEKELYDNFGIVSPSLPYIPSAIDGPSNVDAPVVASHPSESVDTHALPSSSTLSPAAELQTTHQPRIVSPPDIPSAILAKFEKELWDNFGFILPSLPDIPSAIDGPSNIDAPVVASHPPESVVIHAPPLPSTQSPAGAPEATLPPSLSLQSPNSSSHHLEFWGSPVEAAAGKHLVFSVSSAVSTSHQAQAQRTTQIDSTSDVNQVEHRALEPIPPKRMLIAQILHLASCCGDAVADCHDA